MPIQRRAEGGVAFFGDIGGTREKKVDHHRFCSGLKKPVQDMGVNLTRPRPAFHELERARLLDFFGQSRVLNVQAGIINPQNHDVWVDG